MTNERRTEYQNTIKSPIWAQGIDLPSGNLSGISVEPAAPDTGIVFKSPRGEMIKATLENAVASKFLFTETLILQGDKDKIAVPEHILADLKSNDVDNAIIEIIKLPSLSSSIMKYCPFGSGKDTTFVPDCGMKLCESLYNNLEKQDKPRKILRLTREIQAETNTKRGGAVKFSLIPNKTDDLIIHVHIAYPPDGRIISQDETIVFSPENIKKAAMSRAYCRVPGWSPKWLTKFISRFFFITHGYGNGNSDANVFYPVKSQREWGAQERMEKEVAIHTAYDRRGELALLSGTLRGVDAYCRFAGHRDVLNTLKNNSDKFYVE